LVKLQQTLLTFSVVLFIVFLNINTALASNDTFIKKTINGTVFIKTDIGLGFFIKPNGLIAINYHVLAGAKKISLALYNGETFEVKHVYMTKDMLNKDLSLLKINKDNCQSLLLADTLPSRSSKVFAIGHPHGHKWGFSEGFLSAKDNIENGREVIQISADLSPGNSGGAICSDKGEVIGNSYLS